MRSFQRERCAWSREGGAPVRGRRRRLGLHRRTGGETCHLMHRVGGLCRRHAEHGTGRSPDIDRDHRGGCTTLMAVQGGEASDGRRGGKWASERPQARPRRT